MNSTFFPCRTSTISKWGRYSALFFYPAIGILSLFALFLLGANVNFSAGYTVKQILVLLLTAIETILISFFMFYMSRKCYRMETRYIAIDNYGFVIRERTDRQYTWDSIGGIVVIAYAADAGRHTYQTQICIFLEPISDGALRKLCDSYLYGAFNRDKYILLDYDPLILNKLEMCIGWPIPDIRSKQLNLL